MEGTTLLATDLLEGGLIGEKLMEWWSVEVVSGGGRN